MKNLSMIVWFPFVMFLVLGTIIVIVLLGSSVGWAIEHTFAGTMLVKDTTELPRIGALVALSMFLILAMSFIHNVISFMFRSVK